MHQSHQCPGCEKDGLGQIWDEDLELWILAETDGKNHTCGKLPPDAKWIALNPDGSLHQCRGKPQD